MLWQSTTTPTRCQHQTVGFSRFENHEASKLVLSIILSCLWYSARAVENKLSHCFSNED
jgi:hypothetical protein